MSRHRVEKALGLTAVVGVLAMSLTTLTSRAAWNGSISNSDNWVSVKVTDVAPATCKLAESGAAGPSAIVAFAMDETRWDWTLGNFITSPNYGNGWYTSSHTENPNTTANKPCLHDTGSSVGLEHGQGADGPWLSAQQLGSSASEEIWFTTTTSGGLLIGLGDSNSTWRSSSYDRQLFLNSHGHLVFAVTDGRHNYEVVSPSSVADGQWHQAVGTIGPDGSTLYLDGQLVGHDANATSIAGALDWWGNGAYWAGAFVRFGYDNLDRWSNDPGHSRWDFNGSLAFGAYYDAELTASQVAQHYAASGR